MAHYKRGKCRRHGRITFTAEKTVLKSLGIAVTTTWEQRPKWLRWFDYGRSPAKWNREMHTRPHRSGAKRIAKSIAMGGDPDGACWPVPGKPTKYFW